jgi:hypothetical protein
MEIQLNHNLTAIIDDSSYPLISKYKWYAAKNGSTYYAQTVIKVNEKQKCFTMHRIIMGNPPGAIDHKNRNGLDNRVDNLRIVTHAENLRNTKGRSKSGCGFKGVYRQKGGKRFMAAIFPSQKYTHLGLYDTAEEAARAYDKKAYELFGEHCGLNFPEEIKK